MGREESLPTVLVASAARDRAALYRAWLQETYRVHTATSGVTMRETLHDDVDVVLLDWHVLESGRTTLLDTLRDQETDCRVVITDTPAECERLPRAADAHHTVPVERSELVETLEQLLNIDGYDALYRQLSALRIRRRVYRTETHETKLATDERFHALTERIAELEDELAALRNSVTMNRSTVVRTTGGV